MDREFEIGSWRIRPHAQEICGPGKRERIDQKAMAVLCVLTDQAGEVVNRKNLMDQVWPETHVTEDVLNVAVSTLRRAMEDRVRDPQYIKTVPRVGYQLIASVKEIEPRTSYGERLHRKPILTIGAALLVSALVMMIWLGSRGSRDTPREFQSLAVLPLANFSGDAQQDYLADGMTEALITGLARHATPKIISRTSVMGYKDSSKSLVEIASELGVEAILEGSIQKVGGRIRVTVQLIDGRSDEHLWAEHYDRDIGDLFLLQEQIATAVSDQVTTRLGPSSRSPEITADAYDAFLKGRFFRNHPNGPDYQKAIDYFKACLAESPEFAPAHAALAEALYMLAEIGSEASREMFLAGKEAARLALQFDGDLAQAHMVQAIGFFGFDWDFPKAEVAFRKALALDPNDTQCRRWYVRFLNAMGRYDEAITQIRRIQSLDPVAYSKITLVNTLVSAQRLEEARTELENLEKVMPQAPQLWVNYALVYEQMGKLDMAFSALKRYLTLSKTPPDQVRALVTAFQRDGPRGVYQLLYASALSPAQGYRSPVLLAGQHMKLGKHEIALALLEQGYRERDMQILWIASDHRFRPLHDNPDYLAIVEKVGVPIQIVASSSQVVNP